MILLYLDYVLYADDIKICKPIQTVRYYVIVKEINFILILNRNAEIKYLGILIIISDCLIYK